MKSESIGSHGLCSVRKKPQADVCCQLFAGSDGTKWWIFKGWVKKRGSLVCCCVQVGVFCEGLFCETNCNFRLAVICVSAVSPAVFLQSLAEDVPMALLGDGLDLFSVFQYNFFNQYFWNAVFFYFVFISYVTAMLFILATMWVETEWFAVPKTVYSSNVCLWSCAKYKLH